MDWKVLHAFSLAIVDMTGIHQGEINLKDYPMSYTERLMHLAIIKEYKDALLIRFSDGHPGGSEVRSECRKTRFLGADPDSTHHG